MDVSPSASPSGAATNVRFTTPEEALRAVGALLVCLATEQPAALAIIIGVVLASALVIVVVPTLITACVWKRRREQSAYAALSSTERLAMRHPEDMHVTLDDSGEEMATITPAKGSFKLPRLSIPIKQALEDDDADMHMTPRTRANIIRKWTPRKQ